MASRRLPLGNWNWSFFSDAAWPLRVQTFAVYAAVIAGLIGLIWLSDIGSLILGASPRDLLFVSAGVAVVVWVVALAQRPRLWRKAREKTPLGRAPPLAWRVAIDVAHLVYAALTLACAWWLFALMLVRIPDPWWTKPLLLALAFGMPTAFVRMQGFFLRRFGWAVAMGF